MNNPGQPVNHSPNTIALLGGRGMLGTDLGAELKAAGMTPLILDLPECDVTNAAHLRDALADVDAVVNCAAFTNVDGAESARDTAAAVNAQAPGVLGCLARERGVHVLHISTDFVFDGLLDRPYAETDEPAPLSVYGATKLEGERRLLDSGCAGAVVRVQWTYGQGGTNFLTKFLERALASDELMMVDDQIGAPTWTADVARALVQLLRLRATGLHHYAAAGHATRFEVAQAILELLQLKGKHLRPCRTADFPAAAERPLNSRFDCAKIDALPGIVRPPWRESLEMFLSTLT